MSAFRLSLAVFDSYFGRLFSLIFTAVKKYRTPRARLRKIMHNQNKGGKILVCINYAGITHAFHCLCTLMLVLTAVKKCRAVFVSYKHYPTVETIDISQIGFRSQMDGHQSAYNSAFFLQRPLLKLKKSC